MTKELQENSYQYKAFEKLNYAGEKFHQKIFEECIFTNCDFSDCDFFKSRFVDCFFIDCNLSTVKFSNAGLQNISFRECKLLGIDFGACENFLFEVKFESCVLDFSSFMDKKMPNTLFDHTSLKNVVFIKTKLKGAKFADVDLDGAIFEETDLTEADLVTAFNFSINPKKNIIKKASFSLDGLPGLLHEYKLNIT